MPGISKPSNQFYASGPKPVIDYWDAAVAAIEQGRLVKLASATTVEKAAAGDFTAIGYADRDLRKTLAATYAIGDPVPVSALLAGQYVVLIAGAAITVGSKVETGADGKVVTYAPTVIGDSAAVIGIAVEAAAADLDRVLIQIGRG